MEMTIQEGTACVRVLVAVAKADGKITQDEREALEAALEQLPASSDLRPFLEEDVALDGLLAAVTSPHARDQLWHAAYSMVHCDGKASVEEELILGKIRAHFQIDDEKASATKRLIDEAKDTLLPSNINAIENPEARQKEIDQDVLKYAVLSALLGAFPVPGVAIATDLAIVALQVKLVRDIGQYWGHKVDKDAAKSLLAGLGLGTGARIAVANVAKLVPVWGSAFGASSAFATTWALGKLANRYFERGQQGDLRELRKEMKSFEKQGRDEYTQQKQAVEAKRKEASFKLTELNEQRKQGKLSQAEYERRVAALTD
jgi:uncharacterized protein (DUF697 family)